MKALPIVLLVLLGTSPLVLAEEETASPEPTPAAETSEPAATPDAAAELVVIQAEDTAAMQSKVGSEVIIEGFVKNVGKGPNDGITFINFGDRKTGFVAVIFRQTYDKFPERFEKYANQKVRVRGALENFRDRQMQIKISTPDQLEIVASAP
jgi:hypothetical protein